MTDLRLVDDLIRDLDACLEEPMPDHGRQLDANVDYFYAISLFEKYMGKDIGFLMCSVLECLDEEYADTDAVAAREMAFRTIHRRYARG